MPYAIAHPVAVIPVARVMGRHAVVSALVIGSVIPDSWYFVPGLSRPFSHNPSGLLFFCLPAGLAAYLLFHLLVKEPLLQLMPRALAARARAFACAGLPAASWIAVVASLLIGAATHLAWDALTHEGRLYRTLEFLDVEFGAWSLARILQHASTLLGGAFLVWWTARRLRAAPPVDGPVLPVPYRIAVLACLLAVAATFFAAAWLGTGSLELRLAARVGAVASGSGLGGALVLYSVLFHVLGSAKQRQGGEGRNA